jgi:hypothetical protein
MFDRIRNWFNGDELDEADIAFIGVPSVIRDHMQMLYNRHTRRSLHRLGLLHHLCHAYGARNVRSVLTMTPDELAQLPPTVIVPEILTAWSDEQLQHHLDKAHFPHRYEIRIHMIPIGSLWTHRIEIERDGLRVRKFEPMHDAQDYNAALDLSRRDAAVIREVYERVLGVEQVTVSAVDQNDYVRRNIRSNDA